MRRHRHRARAERAHEQARRGRDPERGGDHDVGGRRAPRPRSCPRRRARARGRAGASGWSAPRRRGRTRSPPSRARSAAAAARAGTAAARRAPPGRRTRSGAGLRGRRRAERRRAGAQHAVVGREDPLHQLARGLERGGARVEAAEEQLDEAARHLGGEHALGGRVERADVERARVAQRDRRRARRERLVDVDELGRRGRSAPPRSCARCPAAAPGSRRGARRPAAAARRRRAPARRRRGRTARRCGCRRRESRTSVGSCEGASTTTRCPERGLLGGEAHGRRR